MSRSVHSVASATDMNHFPQFLRLEFLNDVLIRKVDPYAVVKKIVEVTGEKPASLVSETKSAFAVKTISRNQALNILTINSIEGYECKASIHPNLNFSKGLIFLREFDISDEDLPDFKADLKENCGVTNIEPAPFIKSSRAKAYIVTFKGKTRPYSLYIPG